MTTCCLGSVPKNKGIVSKYSNMKSNWNDNQTEKRLALTCFNISISTCPFDMKAGLHRDIPNPFFCYPSIPSKYGMPQHPKEMYLTVSSMHFKKAWEASPSRIPLNRTCQSSLKLNLHIFCHFLGEIFNPMPYHVFKISILCQATTKTPQFPWKFPFFFNLHGFMVI